MRKLNLVVGSSDNKSAELLSDNLDVIAENEARINYLIEQLSIKLGELKIVAQQLIISLSNGDNWR